MIVHWEIEIEMKVMFAKRKKQQKSTKHKENHTLIHNPFDVFASLMKREGDVRLHALIDAPNTRPFFIKVDAYKRCI